MFLDAFCQEHGYKTDILELSVATDQEKLKGAYGEHIHFNDAEVRYVLNGCLVYDIRDPNDSWVEVRVNEGQLFSLAPNVYHRFHLGNLLFIYLLSLA